MSAPTPYRCEFCGYDHTGISSGLCPECGRPVQRFTDRAREVIALANATSLELRRRPDPLQRAHKWWLPHSPLPAFIYPCHVLLGIVNGPRGVGYHALVSCGCEPRVLGEEVLRRLPKAPSESYPEGTQLPLSSSTHQLVRTAINEAHRLNHTWVGTEHFLLALGRDGDRISRISLSTMSISYTSILALVLANKASPDKATVDEGSDAATPGATSDKQR